MGIAPVSLHSNPARSSVMENSYHSIKSKSFSILQERRRKETIEKDRLRRDAMIAYSIRRNVDSSVEREERESSSRI